MAEAKSLLAVETNLCTVTSPRPDPDTHFDSDNQPHRAYAPDARTESLHPPQLPTAHAESFHVPDITDAHTESLHLAELPVANLE